jgi:chloramphenicol-sensitive protein RarD
MTAVPAPGSARGVLSGVGAYAIWGMFPIYFKAVATVPALEVLAHRIVWSVGFLALIVGVRGGWRSFAAIRRDRRLLGHLVLSAITIAVNWGLFIWAVASERILEASLGYFINPLVSVLLGVVVLGERLSRLRWLAVATAFVGCAWQIVALGAVPWLSLALAASFGAYGLLRKTAAIDAVTGLLVEAIVLAPVALGYLLAVHAAGAGAFGRSSEEITLLLVLAGPLTALPLILFVAGARLIPLATLGLLQYITPTGQFLLAVFVYREPFGDTTLVTFAFVWLALVLYTVDAVRRQRAP